ncbi:MAG TPA: UvrD-helicase domain-containing protein [Anaerolineaceae bacterium]|nr:UvrD-helicase domain-containing protein [Anaerolineaceae bacterium]
MTNHRTEQVLNLFTLNEKQQIAATERGRDVVVTAGAGSGKTSTLVARYTCLLSDGTKPRSIAAITFSIKAAQEMRSRVRSKLMELEEKSVDESERLHWSKLSSQIDSARIGTIHSLCAEIIRNHPAEAGVDPRFDVIDDGLSKAIKAKVVEEEMARLVEEERFLPLLYNIPVANLTKLLAQMLERRLETQETFDLEIDNHSRLLDELRERMNSPLITNPISELREIDSRDLLEDAGAGFAEMVQNLLGCWSSAENALAENDPFACAVHLYNARRNYMAMNVGKKTSYVKPIIAELRHFFAEIIDPLTGGEYSTDVPPTREAEERFAEILPLLRLAFDRVQQAYVDQLTLRQALDFDDLEFHAQQLLAVPEVRQRWREELEVVMVDEYQDTNPRQRDIVNALAGDRGCLFMVGDMRQSIYRFRRADVTVFREEQKRIDDEDGLVVDLDRTYRAHEELLNATGNLLSHIIGTKEDPVKKYYVPYTPLVANFKEPKHPVRSPYVEYVLGAGEDTAAGRLQAARALAVRLQQLKDEGQINKWDEVVLLFRATTAYPFYEQALEEAGIAFVTVAGKGFYDRPEIRDLLNILRAVADPLDNLSFAGLLRSPAFGLSDAALFLLRRSDRSYFEALRGDLSLLSEQDRASAQRALFILNKLIPLVDRVPVAELLKRVVDELDYRAILATADVRLEQGQSIKAAGRLWRNLDKLIADTQLSKATTVREFLDMLETLNDAGAREGEASAEAEGSVRLMTIHRSKGLEFPVVVLADAGRQEKAGRNSFFLSDDLGVTFKTEPASMLYNLAKFQDADQDKCEALRILYVALTRAQSKLIISGHAKLEDGVIKLTGCANDVDDALGLPSLEFSRNSSGPIVVQTQSNYPVRVWCSMGEVPFSAVQEEASIEDSAATSDRVPLYQPAEGFGQAELPDDPERDLELQSWRVTRADSRVSGKVLGKIVHKAVQRWLFPGDDGLDALLESEAWRAGLATKATRSEVTARANELLSRFRAHPLWHEVDAALEHHSELPYSYIVDGKVENRVIDLLYREVRGWHIIDFKSDPIQSFTQKEHLIQEYAPQVRRYKAIVDSKLDTSVQGVLCFMDDHGEVSLIEV